MMVEIYYSYTEFNFLIDLLFFQKYVPTISDKK